MPLTAARQERASPAWMSSVLLAILGLLVTVPAATAASPGTTPGSSAVDHPAGTLQALIDQAAPGDVVVAPPGVYRETVSIDHPLTVRGTGAEIRGSDIWTEWTQDADRWVSAASVPPLEGGGFCDQPRCAWPEQVFVDGAPQLQVADTPGHGQFAIDPGRHVILAEDPSGHVVEVTVRPYWMHLSGPDVTVEGFAMRHAASPAQLGALDVGVGADRATIRDVTLEDAHGALVSFHDVQGASLLDSDLERGGQLGVQAGGSGTRDLTIEGNKILDNNTEGFAPAWEAGGLKAGVGVGLRVTDNIVSGNDGAGIWCDVDCKDVTIARNRVSDNSRQGVMFEISDGAVIEDNVVWDNGWGFATWGWGSGILISTATDAIVRRNTVAWNADGISVVSQIRDRPAGDEVTGVQVTDNTVIQGDSKGFLLGWLQDWDGSIWEPQSENTGSGNRFWVNPTLRDRCPFEWRTCVGSVAPFAATAGGHGSLALTDAGKQTALVAAGLVTPTGTVATPEPHVVNDPPRWRTLIPIVGIGALSIGVLGAIVVAMVVRNRSRARKP